MYVDNIYTYKKEKKRKASLFVKIVGKRMLYSCI